MCVNYVTVSRHFAFAYFRFPIEETEEWREELFKDYVGPIIIHDDACNRKGLTGTYGFIPKEHMPPGQLLTTMDARAEAVALLRSYMSAWYKSAWAEGTTLPSADAPFLRAKLGATYARALVHWNDKWRAVRCRRPEPAVKRS